MACQITYKNKKYDYEGFMSLLAKGEFNSLVENGSIDVSKLKGEYEGEKIKFSFTDEYGESVSKVYELVKESSAYSSNPLAFALDRIGVSAENMENAKESFLRDFISSDLPSKLPKKNELFEIEDFPNENLIIKPIEEKVIPLKDKSLKSKRQSLKDIVSKDDLRPVVQGVFQNAEKGEIAATDAHKLIVLKDKSIKKSQIIIDSKDGEQIVEGNYPNYNSVIPMHNPLKHKVSVSELLPKLKGIARANKFIDMPLILAKVTFGEHEFTFDAQFFFDVLKVFSVHGIDNVVLEFSTPNRAMTIRGGDILGLLMPKMGLEGSNRYSEIINEALPDQFEEELNKIHIEQIKKSIEYHKEQLTEDATEWAKEYHGGRIKELNEELKQRGEQVVDVDNQLQEQQDIEIVQENIDNGTITKDEVQNFIETENSDELAQSVEIIADKAESDDKTELNEVIKEVNETIKKRGRKRHAIQIETAGQVPVQPTPGDRRKVEEGKPKTKPEKVAKEVKEEKVEQPKVEVKEEVINIKTQLEDVKKSLDNLVSEGVYSKGQVQGLLDKVKKNFEDLQAGGKPTSADVSFAYLMELVKAKAEKEGKQLSNKAHKALAKEVIDNLKKLLSTKERQFITPAQYNSIIRRISNATTDKARQKALDYVNETVIFGKGAKFKAQLSEARNNIKKIKDANSGDKSKFGTARKLAEEVSTIDVAKLDYDQLREFNHLANRIFRTKALPDTKPLLLIHGLFGDVQKQPKQKEEKIKTVSELIEYIESAKEMYELVSEDGNIVFDLPSYVFFKRMLNYSRKRAVELFNELADTTENQAERKRLEELIGSIEVEGEQKAGLIKEQMEEFRQEFAQRIITRLRSQETKDGIETLENKYLRSHAMMFYETPSAVIQSLDMKDLLSLNSAIDNLREGQIVPEMLHDLQIRMNVQRKINTNYLQAFENVSVSKLWKDFKNRGFKNLIPELRSIFKARSEVEELERYLMSKQAFRIDTALGNFSLIRTLGKAFSEVGIQINKATNHKEKVEKELQKAYEKFAKGKRKHKFIIRYGEDEQQLWRRIVGMYLIERRWQESDSFKDNFNKDNASLLKFVFELHKDKMLPDNKKAFEEDTKFYERFMEFMRQNNATTMKDGVEIVDLAKADALLRKDEGINELINAIDKVVGELKGINEVSALYNNRSLEWRPNYVPFMRKDKGHDYSDKNMSSIIQRMSAGAQMEAGATHEWTEQKMYIETDVVKSLNRYIDEVLRNYYVAPTLRENRMALQQASKLTADKDIQYLGNALTQTLDDRVAMYYRAGIYRNENRILAKLETGSKKALLAKLSKTVVETVANVERMIMAMGKIPFESWDRIRVNHDVWNQVIADNIGESAFTRWADEIDETVFKKTVLKTGEKIADWMITYADKTVGRPIFVQHFLDTFQKETGKDFNENLYRTSESYRLNNADAISMASTVGLRRTEELFNNKNPLSQPQLIGFLGGLIKGSRDRGLVRGFNYLMSFGRNETNQLVDSVRRISYGGQADRLMGIRDILSLVFSNFSYGVLRTMSSYYEAVGLAWVASLFTQGDGDDNKYIDEKKQQLRSGKFYIDFATMKLLPDLVIGGSTNVVEYTSTLFLYLFEKNQGMDSKTKEFIYEVFKKRYMEIMPLYASPERTLVAASPAGFQPVMKDVISLSQSMYDTKLGVGTIVALISAIDDAQKEGLLTEKEVYDVVNILNIGTKYFGFNPLVPYIERQMNQRMWILRKEAAKEKKEGTSSKKATTTQAVD